ncbi:MAG: hypothetical protein OHK006_04670 [Thermodesulfovibrionales bacterium]
MTIGILVNTDRHRDHAVGICRAAVAKGNRVLVFVMDSGVRLLEDAAFTGMAGTEGVSIGFCAHSSRRFGIPVERIPEGIAAGSQMDNAAMQHAADRVLVL